MNEFTRFIGLLTRPGTRRSPIREASTRRPRRRLRLEIEHLEARTVPALLTVGPGLAYAHIQDAISIASAGDTIQIEPGAQTAAFPIGSASLAAGSATGASTIQTRNSGGNTQIQAGEVVRLDPGVPGLDELAIVNLVVNNNSNTATSTLMLAAPLQFAHASGATVTTTGNLGLAKNISVVGDQAFTPSGLPELGPLYVADTTAVTLSNLNLNTVTLLGSGTSITNSLVQGNIVNQMAMNNGAPVPVGGTLGVVESTTSGGGDFLKGNTINGSIYLAFTANEQVSSNTFVGAGTTLQGTSNFASKLHLSHVANASVLNNSFTVVGIAGVANNGIMVDDSTSVTVKDNHVLLNASSVLDNGIEVSDTDLFNVRAATQVDVRSNAVNSLGIGVGLLFNGASGGTIAARVQGNDFRGDRISVEVNGDGTNSLAGIDLGSSPTGSATQSLGANDFRDSSYTAPATTTHAAIVLLNVPATFTLVARQNLFSPTVGNPHALVVDSSNGGAGTIDVTQTLSPDQAFVQSTYITVFGRVGQLTVGEINGWVSLLPTLGQGGVANAIVHSAESDQYIISRLYQQFLGRAPDPQGLAGFSAELQAGATVESITVQLMTSQEYRLLVNRPQQDFNAVYVQSVYNNLLHRQPSAGEVQAWVSQINTIGYAGVVAGIVGSAESRAIAVAQYYTSLLHRTAPPTQAEVSGWVNSPLDLLSIEAAIVGSREAYLDG